ncbi:hypothetical protein [Streptomyces sp. NPDC001604]|uniref:hypothetical protein n=1 Tax=Streptomyces sp. NPDC001604 TaxID=3364593 RepID=UPI0036856805
MCVQTGELALGELQGVELGALQPRCFIEVAPLQTDGALYGNLGEVQLTAYSHVAQS